MGLAPVFPNLIHITPQRFGAASSQAVIGLQMAAAYVGSTLMPPLVGLMGQTVGFGILPYYQLLCLAALSVARAAFVYMVLGVGAIFVGLVTFFFRHFAPELGAPVALILSGGVLVAGVLVLAQARKAIRGRRLAA